MSSQVDITFPEVSAAERSRLASKLHDTLGQVAGVKTSILRERPDTQDPGTILAVVLAGPSVVLAVKAIGAWLVRDNVSSVTIQLPDGTIILENMKSGDVPKAIEAVKNVVEQP